MEQHYELTSTPELLTPAAYVSKDGLVGHHWKERPIGVPFQAAAFNGVKIAQNITFLGKYAERLSNGACRIARQALEKNDRGGAEKVGVKLSGKIKKI